MKRDRYIECAVIKGWVEQRDRMGCLMHDKREYEVSLFGGKGLEIFQGKHKVLNR